ncbi:MAG: SDR family NAD(P)-dependent oxidoreductase [Phycisphaerae bacterium]
MNIIIMGCGNIGFEAAKLLAEKHSILVVSRRCPDYLQEFLQQNGNVSFMPADATNTSAIESILNRWHGQVGKVDALVCTVGALCASSPTDNFDKFQSSFNQNFFGNLVPIKAVLRRMIPAKSGKIVVLSSTSGVFAYKGLSSYVPAKWALTSLCRALRSELRPYGISVDILLPRSIRNKRSRTFLNEHGIPVEMVTRKIAGIVENGDGTNHFVPKRYALLHPLERIFPRVLDKRARLQNGRKKRFKLLTVDSVLITGASSELGKELAKLYARTAKTLYLVARNKKSLQQAKNEITKSSACTVRVASVDMADRRAVTAFADTIDHADLLINNAGFPVIGQVSDVPIDAYKQNLATDFFGPVQLTAEFLKKGRTPIKIVNILPMSVIGGRKECSSYSAPKAALWAFTRSLRRTAGNELQVIEVLPSTFQSNFSKNTVRIKPEQESGFADSRHKSKKALPVRGLTAQDVAEAIYEAERKGREIVLIPFRSRLFLYLDAIFPWLFQRLFE